MTQEEKAKRYDEVVKEIKGFFEGKQKMPNDVDKTLELLFPELKESEGERIRKQLLNWFKGCHWDAIDDGTLKRDDIITWLEKQGEQKPQGKSALEAINEEKVDNANKVEPKFKVDWIVANKDNSVSHESNYHLWSIKDAKPGDILASKDGKSILIFRHFSLDDDTFASYYSITFSSYYYMQGYDEYNWLNTNFVPATKEQRDLLFQKMQEAGYEWDSEKKQLRKIESNFYLE